MIKWEDVDETLGFSCLFGSSDNSIKMWILYTKSVSRVFLLKYILCYCLDKAVCFFVFLFCKTDALVSLVQWWNTLIEALRGERLSYRSSQFVVQHIMAGHSRQQEHEAADTFLTSNAFVLKNLSLSHWLFHYTVRIISMFWKRRLSYIYMYVHIRNNYALTGILWSNERCKDLTL